MQIVPCPSCRTPALLPEQLPLEATVGCPHCGQLFVLGEVLICQFASWEVVVNPSTIANESQADPSDCTLQRDGKLAIDASIIASLAAQPGNANRHGSFSRHRRQPSGLLSMLPIIGGGLAAFPLALLILWYGLGRDVGGLGAQIAQYVPWIVPAKFHADP